MTRFPTSTLRRLLLRFCAASIGAVALAAAADGGKPLKADRIVLPAEAREFRSASGSHVFTVTTSDHWKSRQAVGQLFARSGDGLKSVWQATLPQERGPRHVLVLDTGAVVLMDEWINIPSRYALMLFSPDGRQLTTYGIDDIVQRLGVTRRVVADHGKLGVWLSAVPTLSDGGSEVVFRSGGRRLTLRVADGRLVASD